MIPIQHTLNTNYSVGPVHCYSQEIAGELVLFDTGPPDLNAQKYLQNNVNLDRLQHVIITHCHIDHYGLARWLEQETDAVIYLPFRDHLRIVNHEKSLELMYGLMGQLGFTSDFLAPFQESMAGDAVFPPLPEKFKIIEEDLPEHLGLTALSCPGHSQSDMVLLSEDWAVTGDVLLQGIFQTPLLDIDLQTGERFRNYNAYCNSLIKLATLRGKHILPGHRGQIDSVDGCLLVYIDKLLDRAARVKQLPLNMTAAAIVNKLFEGANNPFVGYLKASEVVFMRDFLAQPHLLKEALISIGLYAAVADKFAHVLS